MSINPPRRYTQSLGWPSWVALSLLLLVVTCPLWAQTNFEIGSTVKVAGAKRLGMNVGGQDYYDSGQMLRNLIFANPGFEAETWQSSIKCASATSTSCTDANIYNVWPANFLQGATFEVISGAGLGETGTITTSTVASYSGNTGLTFNFAALSKSMGAGDYVIVHQQFPGNPLAGWWNNATGGATFAGETTDIAADSPGKQAVAVNAAASGQTATVMSFFDSYAGRSFLQLNGTYTVAFKAKGVSGNNQLNIAVTRNNTSLHGTETLLNQNVTLTGQWQDYSYTFTAAEDGTYIGIAEVAFSVAGASIYLDDATLTEAAAADNPTAYRNAVVDTLKSLQPGILRYNTQTDIGSTTDNTIAVPFARQRAGISSQATEQDDVPAGLEEFLVLCQTVGAEPWYTMAGEASTTDMQNLIEFLGGAATTPYGAKRAALGQTAPWTSVFPSIHLELGNEMWNAISAGEAIGDPAIYGARAAKIFAAARASTSYDSTKFDLVLGSWAAIPSWTQAEMANSSGYDSVDAAPYLFNSLNDYGSNEAIFGPMFAQPEEVDSVASGYMAQQMQVAATASTPAKLEVYEVNLSTTTGTAPQNIVNQAAAGLGAGIALADHMLLMMRDLGITTQMMFALPNYVNNFTNASISGETFPLWGSVIDMGGQTNLKRPQFLAEQLANTAILPSLLATTVTGDNFAWTQPLSTNDSIQLASAHYLQAFAFTDGTHHSVVVFNLSRSGALPITFSGANAPSGSILISQLTSANLTDNNEGLFTNKPVVAGPTQTNVANFQPATPYSLPPYSMTVFLWPGAALPSTTTTLQASPTAAIAGKSITLTATVTSQANAVVPTGTVTFLNGTTKLGTASVAANGQATLGVTSLPVGADAITASYGGDAGDAASVSTPVTVTISAAPVATTTTLTASASSVTVGQSVTFTATVTPPSGSTVATGSVAFLDGTTTLGTAQLNASGVATYSTTSLAVGSHTVTAAYAGDAGHTASTSAAVTVTVAPAPTPAFSMTVSGNTLSLTAGKSGSLTVTLTPANGFQLPISLACTGAPQGSTCSFSPASVTPSGAAVQSTVTVVAASQTAFVPSSAPLAFAWVIPWVLLPLLGLARRSKAAGILGATALCLVVAFGVAGCGGSSAATTTPTAPQATTFTLTLTATSSDAETHSSQVTVTVQP